MMQLSAEQRAAVERSGQDVCCVAGPGSGKTAVLVERFAHLVEQGTDARAILAITFTDKAATQIKTRLVKRFDQRPALRRAVERAPVSTLHSFCMGLLREHALAAGLDPNFDILDAHEAAAERGAAMDAVLDRLAIERTSEFEAWAVAWPAQDHSRELLGVHERLRMGGGVSGTLTELRHFEPDGALNELERSVREMVEASPAGATEAQRRRLDNALAWLAGRSSAEPFAWLAAAGKFDKRGLKAGHPFYDGLERVKELARQARRELAGALYEPQRDFAVEALRQFEEEYARRKRLRAVLDFADLEEFALALLESNEPIRRSTAERYDAILMDELQDTNPIQWKILDQVRRPGRFFAVGDINQSIYGFRDAAPEQFLEYQRRVAGEGGAIDRLEANYRSRPEILAAVTAITVSQPCAGVTEHRLFAGREFTEAPGPVVEVQIVEPGEEGGEESAWIARRLRELHDEGVASYAEMAVLARTNTMFDELEAALSAEGVPSVVQRGRNFFAEPEIVDLISWLRVLYNPSNEIALLGVLRSPFFRIPDEELLRGKWAGQMAPSEVRDRIERARALREETPADRILARLMDECGVAHTANTEKFLRILRELDTAAPGNLAGHIEQIDTFRAAGDEPNAPLVEATDAVQLMSIHSAKGLEFPVVVLAYMQRGSGGKEPPIAWSPRLGLGMRWRLPDGSTESDGVYAAIQSEREVRESEETDRLLYVAMTRAEQRLILSWTARKRSGSPWPDMVERGLGVVVEHRVGLPEPLPSEDVAAAVELPVLTPVVDAGQASASVAVTALATFAVCPRQYYLRHSAAWPVEPGEGGTGAIELGIETHELLAGRRTEASSEARELARVFEESELGRRAHSGARVRHEEDFLVELDGTLVRGQIDLHWNEPSGTVLVDYKTDRSMDEPRRRAYALQMQLYALAWERMNGRLPVEAWLFALRDVRAEQIEIQTEEARALLHAWREAEVAGDFPPQPGEACRRCAYRGPACPAGVE